VASTRAVWFVSTPTLLLVGLACLPLGVPVFVAGLTVAPEDLGGVVFGGFFILLFLAYIPRCFVRVSARHLSHGRFPFRWSRIPCPSIASIGTVRRTTAWSTRDHAAVLLQDGSFVRLAIWSYGAAGPDPEDATVMTVRNRDRLRAALASVGCGCSERTP